MIDHTEVHALSVADFTYAEIAQALGVSPATVARYFQCPKGKLAGGRK